MGLARSGSTARARATGWSSLAVASAPAHTKPTGRTANQPPEHSRSVTGSAERDTLAPARRYPTVAAVALGSARIGTVIAIGASFGAFSGGTGTFDQSFVTRFGPPFSAFTFTSPGSPSP